MEKRYVGILVNSSLYKKIPSGRTLHECLHFYEDAGKHYSLIPSYFRLQDIKPGQDEILAYIKEKEGYVQKQIPLPNIIHNRAIYFTTSAKKRIDRLTKEGTTIFNQWNRYGKLKIHNLLMQKPNLRPHLPETMLANTKNLRYMMKTHNSIIMKPNNSSIGRGIMKLERKGSAWKLTYPDGIKKTWKTISFTHIIPKLLARRFQTKKYIIQMLLPLATHEGRPFDLRVSVQRNINGGWQVTGIVGKVAKKKAFLTNVAQGGTVHSLVDLIQFYPLLSGEDVYDRVVDFSIQVAHHLETQLPNLADIGLDIGVTESGFPMFIECNGRDLRYIFQENQMFDTWKASYCNPIGYARYLMDR